MDDLNRIRVVLIEQEKQGNGWRNKLRSHHAQLVSSATIPSARPINLVRHCKIVKSEY